MDAISQLTARTVDPEHIYTLFELNNMPLEALDELYRAIPPDTQELFEESLQEGLIKQYGDRHAGEAEQITVIDSCLDLYEQARPLIPLDRYEDTIRWIAIPPGVLSKQDKSSDETQTEIARPKQNSVRPYLMAGAIGLSGLCLIFTILRSAFASPAGPTEDELTATAVAAAQLAMEPPTPTPLALENIDRPIGAGENLRDRYPVILEITRADGAPRVFAVQQKSVDIAEWNYVADKDVASSILGLVIRPVLGIPYNEENKSYLESLMPGDRITLRMSTNQILHYNISHSQRIAPQSADIFNQNAPGVVIALLADPAPDRLVVFGNYQPAQEISDSRLPNSDVQTSGNNQPVKHGDSGVAIAVLSSAASQGPAGSPLPTGWTYLLVDLEITTRQPLDTAEIDFRLLDQTGTGYSPATVDPSITTYPPFERPHLPAGGETKATLGFLIPSKSGLARLVVQVKPEIAAVTYNLDIPFNATSLTARDLDVQILTVQTEGKPETGGELSIKARLYNPYQAEIQLRIPDVYVVYSPSVIEKTFPVGPSTSPIPRNDFSLPLTIEPGKAVDAEFRFDWRGDIYVGIVIGGYQFAATLY